MKTTRKTRKTTSGPTISEDERLKRGQTQFKLRMNSELVHRVKTYCNKHGIEYGTFAEQAFTEHLNLLDSKKSSSQT